MWSRKGKVKEMILRWYGHVVRMGEARVDEESSMVEGITG